MRDVSARKFFNAVALIALSFAIGAPAAVGSAAEEARKFAIDLVDGQPREARRSIRVRQGDKTIIRWTSDKPAELHLHGYDLHAAPAPGAPAEMRFQAHSSGRFPVELHGGGHRPVIYLEVYPD